MREVAECEFGGRLGAHWSVDALRRILESSGLDGTDAPDVTGGTRR